MTVQNFSHVGICTGNLDRAIAFYREVLGFAEVSKTTVGAEVGPLIEIDTPNLQLHSRFLERDHMRLELMGFEAPAPRGNGERGPFNHRGLTHLAIRVTEIDDLLGKVVEYGGSVLEHTRVGQEDIGVELIYILDPDGVRIELIRLPGDSNMAPGEPLVPE